MTTPGQPLEARCDRCKQPRALFLYLPDHNAHLVPVTCEWCDREKQPLLCTRCYSVEKQREDNAPLDPDEKAIGDFFSAAFRVRGRSADQTAADRATCDGIAAATEHAGSSE